MPIKVDIQTNLPDQELTLESVGEIIQMLQESIKELRSEMYTHFLNTTHLRNALFLVLIFAFFYLFTQEIIFIYFMPFSIICSMITQIVSAEVITNKAVKQINLQIEYFKEKREKLLKDKNTKA